MLTKYNLNCGNQFGEDDEASRIFNDEFIPFIKKLEIKDKDIEKIYKIVRNIAEEAYSMGGNVAEWYCNGGEGV